MTEQTVDNAAEAGEAASSLETKAETTEATAPTTVSFVEYQNFACSACGCMCRPSFDGVFPLADPSVASVDLPMACQQGDCPNYGINVTVTLPVIQAPIAS